MKPSLIALLLASLALSLQGQSNPRDFAKGPAQWWMTSEEMRAWENVRTDEQAKEFIDLFWARRDPTPGTPRNENRLDFENRVAYADRSFKEGNTRGALTERGRVLIVLGFPKSLSNESAKRTGQFMNVDQGGLRNSQGDAVGDPTGGRTLAAKDTWEYTHEAALKYGVPKIEVVFLFDKLNGGAHRDPQRTDFTMALPNAIKSYIASPEMTTVPDWARPVVAVQRAAGEPAQLVETTTTENRKVVRTIVDVPKPVARPAGAGQLLLLNDSAALRPQSGSDPFSTVANVAQFDKGKELGWAAEYCSGEILSSAPAMKVEVKITAANGDTFSTDPEEFVPDSIKASPGCYLLRGALPLTDFDAGTYKLSLRITGAATGQSYNLDREFRVQ